MEAANGAIEHDFHNALVPINGSHSGSSGRSTPNGGDPAPGKLFVGGLSWQTSSEKLREYFGMFGTVTDVLIMKDPVTQVGLLDGSTLRRLVHLYRWPVSPVLKSKSKERFIIVLFSHWDLRKTVISQSMSRYVLADRPPNFVEFLLSISSSIGQIVRIGVIGRAEGKKIRDRGWDGRA